MQMPLPGTVAEVVRAVVDRYPSDIDAAVAEAVAAVKGLPEYPALVDDLLGTALRRLVADERHARTVKAKRENGAYHSRPKLGADRAATLGRVYRSLYDTYFIGGTVLGDLRGEQLAELAAGQRAIARGSLVNAALLEKLAPLVPSGKTVRQAVPLKKLEKLLEEAKKQAA